MKQKAYLDRVMRLKARTIATVPEIDLEGARQARQKLLGSGAVHVDVS